MKLLIEYEGTYWLVVERTKLCPQEDCNKSLLCKDKCEGKEDKALCIIFSPLVGSGRCAFRRVEP
jgi:hypothetical protein